MSMQQIANKISSYKVCIELDYMINMLFASACGCYTITNMTDTFNQNLIGSFGITDFTNISNMISTILNSYQLENFANNFEFICRIIGIDEIKKNVITNANISEDYLNNTISIHFRIGDYKKIQHIHPVLKKEYYEKALLYIMAETEKKNWRIMYFCEEECLRACFCFCLLFKYVYLNIFLLFACLNFRRLIIFLIKIYSIIKACQ
jgi:hypothetical protein